MSDSAEPKETIYEISLVMIKHSIVIAKVYTHEPPEKADLATRNYLWAENGEILMYENYDFIRVKKVELTDETVGVVFDEIEAIPNE